MNMTPCPRCDGFVPDASHVCPNCDTECRPSIGRKVAAVAAAGATAMTLMACYGIGDYGYEAQWPTTSDEACARVTELPASEGNAYVSSNSDDYRASDALESPCASSSGPERVFRYEPNEEQGRAGKITILWDSPSEHSVFVLRQCGDVSALACGAPAFSGRVEMDVTSLSPFDIVVDSLSDYQGDEFELQVVFEPSP
jgi:hypothetical protein